VLILDKQKNENYIKTLQIKKKKISKIMKQNNYNRDGYILGMLLIMYLPALLIHFILEEFYGINILVFLGFCFWGIGGYVLFNKILKTNKRINILSEKIDKMIKDNSSSSFNLSIENIDNYYNELILLKEKGKINLLSDQTIDAILNAKKVFMQKSDKIDSFIENQESREYKHSIVNN